MQNGEIIVVLRAKLLSEELAEQVRIMEQWAIAAKRKVPDWKNGEPGKHRG